MFGNWENKLLDQIYYLARNVIFLKYWDFFLPRNLLNKLYEILEEIIRNIHRCYEKLSEIFTPHNSSTDCFAHPVSTSLCDDKLKTEI